MDEEEFESGLEMIARLNQMRIEVEVIEGQIRDFLETRGVNFEGRTLEAANNESIVLFMANTYVMCTSFDGDLAKDARPHVDQILQSSGLVQSAWKEAVDHFFGGEERIYIDAYQKMKSATEHSYELIGRVLAILVELGVDPDRLEMPELLLVMRVVNDLGLSEKGLDIAQLQEPARIHMMQSGLNHEPWTTLIEIAYM